MSQHPCLPLPRKKQRRSNSPVQFQDIASMTATEYLTRVSHQAAALPEHFTSVPQKEHERSRLRKTFVPIHGSAASLAYLLSDRTVLYPPTTEQHVPASDKWIDTTIDNFSRLRNYLEQLRCQGVAGKQTNRLPLPPLKDSFGWLMFCIGIDAAQGNEGGYFQDDENISETNEEKDVPAWKVNLPTYGYTPSCSLLLQMDQVMVRRVLTHLGDFINKQWINPTLLAPWIYALLSRLERPIHRDDAARLYRLLRDLTKARTTSEKPELLASLNTLIVIISVYFEQYNASIMRLSENVAS